LENRPYGTTGRTTSIIGLGGAFLTASSFADGVATVHRALDLGVTYFDTSPMYCRGASQAVLGEALEGVALTISWPQSWAISTTRSDSTRTTPL